MELQENLETAIVIRGACKEYEKDQKILDDLNMTVIKGSIYGLLGASGCGKTTLLGAVVGCKQLQNGYISILGEPPGVIPQNSIGYMPQETSLLEEFNIKNCLQYQGYIFGMSDEKIKERHEFLEKLLDLPPANRLVRQLSGGQQRRLSLAVTLVHDPDLLILDEPTVGLDPILRQNLWDYFIKITTEDKKTVIITTHYLEEARQANKIGLLRNGKILSEGEPQELLTEHNCATIEDMFALLSTRQEEVKISVENPPKPDEPTKINEVNQEIRLPNDKNLNKSNFINKGHAKALLLKNSLRIMRNPEILLLAIILPIVELIVFFPVIGVTPTDMQIGIINEELQNYTDCNEYMTSDNFIGGELIIENNDTFCVYSGLSCLYIKNLGSIIHEKVYFKTEEEALKAMKNGQFHFILHFPQNYSESITIARHDPIYFYEGESEFQIINVYRDVKDWNIGVLVEKELYNTYQRFAEKLATDCGASKLADRPPIRFNEPVYGEYDGPFFAQFTAPGIILIITVFCGGGLSLMTYSGERKSGVWERTIVSGVSTTEILIYDSMFLAVIALMQFVEIAIIAFVIFNVECQGNFFNVFLLLYLQSLSGVLEGTVISINCNTEFAALIIGVGVFIPKLFISGVIWPLEGITWTFYRYLCYLSPQSLSVQALRWILYRGWGMSYLKVFLGYLVPVVYNIIFAAVCMITLKYQKK